ncbi:uncharacterized protein ARMOST_16577 [Armillaria ostoyae]|uniref:Uncharacterized protein n=1 Tax=Armillaria ostoyae TaxID=47428 RepID=A0A284RWM9_ARMOS|nr:uncharacterized protein ARMOST_16577 [Armillaria ostoyae]
MLLPGGRLPDDALILSYAALADAHDNPTCLRLLCHAQTPPFHDDDDPRVPSCTQCQDPGHAEVAPQSSIGPHSHPRRLQQHWALHFAMKNPICHASTSSFMHMSYSLAHCMKDHGGGGGRDVSELAETDFRLATTPISYSHVTEKVHCIAPGARSKEFLLLTGLLHLFGIA